MSAVIVQKDISGSVSRIALELNGKLEVVHSFHPETYKVCVYGSSDSQHIGAFNSFALVSDGKIGWPVQLDYNVLPDQTMPYYLHFDVYAIGPDPQMGLLSDLHLGRGRVELAAFKTENKPVVVTIYDIEHQKQAVLTLVSTEPLRGGNTIGDASSLIAATDKDRGVNASKARKSLISKTTEGYAALGKLFYCDPSRVWVSYRCWEFEDAPIVAFVHLTTRILHDTTKSERLLLHLMRVAGCMYGYKLDKLDVLTDDEKGDWLAEMCAIYFRGQLYCHDYYRTMSSDKNDTDEWSCLNAFPSDGLTGFDCEDGAEWILELLMLLRCGVFKSSSLNAMKSFYAGYTAFFTLGTLSTGVGQDPVDHAYVILLDSRFIIQQRSQPDELKPAIVIESTTFTQGCFSKSRIDAGERDKLSIDVADYNNKQVVFMTSSMLEHESKWRRVCKTRSKVAVSMQRHMYIDVWAMVSSSPEDGSVTQYAVHGSNSLGVAFKDLVEYRSHVNLTPVLIADKATLEDMNKENPRSKIPEVPANPRYPLLLDGQTRFTIRAVDFEANKDLFVTAFKEAVSDKEALVNPVKLEITDKVAIYVIDLL